MSKAERRALIERDAIRRRHDMRMADLGRRAQASVLESRDIMGIIVLVRHPDGFSEAQTVLRSQLPKGMPQSLLRVLDRITHDIRKRC